MTNLNLATLGVRLTGIVVIAFALIFGGSLALTQIAGGTERKVETKVDAQFTTRTTTVVKRSFDPLPLVPSAAGLVFGLLLVLASRPLAGVLTPEHRTMQPQPIPPRLVE